MKLLFFIFFSIIIFNNSFAQSWGINPEDTTKSSIKDTIKYEGSLWTVEKFSYKGKQNLKLSEVESALRFDKENRRLVSNARTAKTITLMLGFGGGFCIGYSLGSAIAGKPVNLPLLGVGAGLIVVAIPISMSYSKSLKKAIRNFNNSR